MKMFRFILLVLMIGLCDLYGAGMEVPYDLDGGEPDSQRAKIYADRLDSLDALEKERDKSDIENQTAFIQTTETVMKMIGDPDHALSPLSTDGTNRNDWLKAIYGVLRTTHYYNGMPDLVASMGCKEEASQQALRDSPEYQAHIKTLTVISMLGKKGWTDENFYNAWEGIVQKNEKYTEDLAKNVFNSIECDANSLNIDLAFVQSVLRDKVFMKDVFYIHGIFAPHMTLEDYFLRVLGGGLYHGWAASGTDGQVRWPYLDQTPQRMSAFWKKHSKSSAVSTPKASIVGNTLRVEFLFVPKEGGILPLSFSMEKAIPEDLISAFVYDAEIDKTCELKSREGYLNTFCNWTLPPYTNPGAEGYQRKFALLQETVKKYPTPDILFELGIMYANGQGVGKDEAAAVEWYRRAAYQGFANAQSNLGVMYQNGRGVAQDDAEAVEWYRRAADQGFALAQNNLGFMYQNGRGIDKNEAEAVEWYRRAADQGFAKAQYWLGFMYANGQGIDKNEAEAVEWCRRAADQGFANAQCTLGSMYQNGRGVAQDDAEAVEWYRRAAYQGFAKAQCALGFIYQNGRGVRKDEAEAVKWYRRAADQEFALAQYCLGFMYQNGRGINKNEAEAVKWYRRAADQGLAQAQSRLQEVQKNGQGVDKR